MQLLIVSGRSGSGKSITLQTLEDLGFYCVDNLPVEMLPSLVTKLTQEQPKLAISVDSRNLPKDSSIINAVLHQLKDAHQAFKILYLDASDTILLKRYSETRRKHPLTNDKISLQEAIQQERALLHPIASIANFTIDTSHVSKRELGSMIHRRITNNKNYTLQLMISSFGFKNGVPMDADFIFDVRCLPNPYWQTNLKLQTGLHEDVIKFLENNKDAQLMVADIHRFLENWIPKFEEDHRSYLTISIGCTGGQHRSVYIAEQLAKRLEPMQMQSQIQIRHRDISHSQASSNAEEKKSK